MDNVTGEQKLLAIAAHLTYFLGGLGFIIAPLLLMIYKKDDPFIYHHAKQALAAHLVIFLVSVIVGILCFVLIGFILLPVLGILWIALMITSIIGAIYSANGKLYYYPLIQYVVENI